MSQSKCSRLDKILAEGEHCSRKNARQIIISGSVTVCGKTVRDPAAHIDTSCDEVVVNGKKIDWPHPLYLMMNKPRGVVCAKKDRIHKTIFDILDNKYRCGKLASDLHIIGRLDIDTEGLLILTTDGDLTHRLTSPKSHVGKTYTACLRKTLNSAERLEYSACFKRGVHIDEKDGDAALDCMGALLEWKNDAFYDGRAVSVARLTIYEGKYHQVKRMFASFGNEVVFLKRDAIGLLKLDEKLPAGCCRELTEKEADALIQNN